MRINGRSIQRKLLSYPTGSVARSPLPLYISAITALFIPFSRYSEMFLGGFFCLVVQITVGLSQSISPSTFTAPGAFPTSVYEKYFNSPTATSAQVQPVISDPVTVASPPLLGLLHLTTALNNRTKFTHFHSQTQTRSHSTIRLTLTPFLQ